MTNGLPENFMRKVHIMPDGCWEWIGSICNKGYGQFAVNRRKVMAHRFAYEAVVGPIPKGKELDHKCHNRQCVNPNHLETVTHGENLRHRDYLNPNQSKTHCPKGHPYDERNTYRDKYGKRTCKICKREANREYKRRMKEHGRN